MAHDVFISYSSKDKPVADAVCAGLEARGCAAGSRRATSCRAPSGAPRIIDAITGSKVMVLIFSAHANSSPQIKREVERAVAKGVKLVPFRIEDVAARQDARVLHLDAALARRAHAAARRAHRQARRDGARSRGRARQQRGPCRTVHGPDAGARLPVAGEPPRPAPAARRRGRTPRARRSSLGLWPRWRRALYFFVLAQVAARDRRRQLSRRPSPRAAATSSGTVQFKTGHDAIAQAEFAVVSAAALRALHGRAARRRTQKRGTFSFAIHSSIPQQVTLEATLRRCGGAPLEPRVLLLRGRRSPRMRSAVSIEIEAPHGLQVQDPPLTGAAPDTTGIISQCPAVDLTPA